MSNAIKSFKKTSFKDAEVTKLQSNLEIFLKSIANSQIIDGTLIKNVLLEPSKRNEVLHRLEREPLGYIIVRQRADSRIWDLQDTNTSPKRTFTLACSHLVYVDVWFF